MCLPAHPMQHMRVQGMGALDISLHNVQRTGPMRATYIHIAMLLMRAGAMPVAGRASIPTVRAV